MLEEFLGTISPTVLYLVGALFVIALVLAIIKKAGKIILLLVVLVLICGVSIPLSLNYQDKYGISFEDGNIDMLIDGQHHVVKGGLIESVSFTSNIIEGSSVEFVYKDGRTQNISVPKFISDAISTFCKVTGIEDNTEAINNG